MLFGEYKHTIDKKKRMFLPAKMRDAFGEKVIMVKSLSAKCIALYPEEEWKKFEEKLDAVPEISGVSIRRKIYSSMEVIEPDPQGRILVPQNLFDYAELEKNTVVIGAGHHAEIWSDVNREAEAEKENSPELLAMLTAIGL